MSDKMIARRRLLTYAGIGAGGAFLAACRPKIVVQTVQVEKVVEVERKVVETVEVARIVEVEKEVTRVVEKQVEVQAPVAAKAPEVKGAFWVLQKQDFFPSFNAWFRQAMTDWAKENGWPLDISYMAGYTGGTPEIEKINASVAGGTPADLVMHDMGITQLRQAYSLDPVTDIVEEVETKWGPTFARQRNDLYQDDQWWAVPYFTRSDGGWYRRSVWKDAGIDIAAIRQYADLWEACLEVSDPAAEMYGWGVTINRGGDGDWFRNRVTHGWGAYIQDESGQFVTIDSPEMVAAMTAMTELYMDDKWVDMLPPGVLAWTDSQNDEAYLAGKLAYTQNGDTVYGKAQIDENPVADDTGFHTPVGGPVNAEFNSLGANNFVILRGARNYDAARATIVKFMTDLDYQDNVFRNAPGFCLPAYMELWTKSKFIPTHATSRELQAVATDPNGVIPGTYPGPANSPAISSAGAAGMQNDMVADILRGTSVAEAVKTCHKRYVGIFKEFGLPGAK